MHFTENPENYPKIIELLKQLLECTLPMESNDWRYSLDIVPIESSDDTVILRLTDKKTDEMTLSTVQLIATPYEYTPLEDKE